MNPLLQLLAALQAPAMAQDRGVELNFNQPTQQQQQTQVPTPAYLDFQQRIAQSQMGQLPPQLQFQSPPIFSSDTKDQIASNKQQIFDYLKSKDLDPDFIFAAMANMEEESGFIPSRLQGDPKKEKLITNWFKKTKAGRGTGLAQWDDRRMQLQKFAEERGKSWDDLETQLEFMLQELNTTERKAYERIMQAPNLQVKTRLFANLFERAGTTRAHGALSDEEREKNLQRRSDKALRLRNEFKRQLQ